MQDWHLTDEESYDWLRRHTEWTPDLPEDERRRIEDEYDEAAIQLAIASGFN